MLTGDICLSVRLRHASGFTMIEMLVTLTIFGLLLSSMVVGLRTGVTTWRTIRLEQSNHVALQQALELIRQDIEHLAIVGEDIPFLIETQEQPTGERLRMTVLGNRYAQQLGVGAAWMEIEYRVTEKEGSSDLVLIREIHPKVGPSDILGSEISSVLIEGVSSLEFSYLKGQEFLKVWEDSEALPIAIQVRIHFDKGKVVERTFLVPVGYLQSVAAL